LLHDIQNKKTQVIYNMFSLPLFPLDNSFLECYQAESIFPYSSKIAQSVNHKLAFKEGIYLFRITLILRE
jgi:hypothetical protein